MTDANEIPVARLSYEALPSDQSGWWHAARMVGHLAFWWGVIRVGEIIIDLTLGVFMFPSRLSTIIGPRPFTAAMTVVYLIGILGGGILSIIGGRHLINRRASGFNLVMWGAIALTVASLSQFAQALFVTAGATLPWYYLPRWLLSMAGGLVLPVFVVCFARKWRGQLEPGSSQR